MSAACTLTWGPKGLFCGEDLILAAAAQNSDNSHLAAEEYSADNYCGLLIAAHTSNSSSSWKCTIGVQTDTVLRWSACHRYEPFWMFRKTGSQFAEIPPETQYLLVELTSNRYLIVVPLVDNSFHASVAGNVANELELTIESGDTSTTTTSMNGLYMHACSCPFTLMREAQHAVAKIVPGATLRTDKSLPPFVDWFGWCTWDAFYQNVSEEKVVTGLKSFNDEGVYPRYLILDDGWQQVAQAEEHTVRLTAFSANDKFGNTLSPTVASARKCGVQWVFVWHALNGYWAGVDVESFAAYSARLKPRAFSPGILHHMPNFNSEYWGTTIGLVPPDRIGDFYHDYYEQLRNQGVDGVKVDNQCAIEAVGDGERGRVKLMHAYHDAIETSAQTYFNSNLINCMSCASEVFYQSSNSALIRTSTDFWPNRPETHGLHLVTNAHVSLWFAGFMHPDWDMFQSAHEAGPYHAAARAISGAPVYVSDKPDGHNFDLINKLVLPDGSVLRCSHPALPAKSSLFTDPLTQPVPLKIFNFNNYGAVLGLFHALYTPENPITISTTVTPGEIPDLAGAEFVTWTHQKMEATALGAADAIDILLEPGGFELVTIVPVIQGVAPIGLLQMFNSAGAIVAVRSTNSGTVEIEVKGEGQFAIWCAARPVSVLGNSDGIGWQYDEISRLVTFPLHAGTRAVVVNT